MGKTKRPSSAARSSQKANSNKPVGVVGLLMERGDPTSVFAAELIAMLQDACWKYSQDIRRLKGD